jgi:hypothetical protein
VYHKNSEPLSLALTTIFNTLQVQNQLQLQQRRYAFNAYHLTNTNYINTNMKQCLLSVVFMLWATVVYANDEILLEYIDWIVANSDFEYNGEELPLIAKVPSEEIQVIAYGEDTIERAKNGEFTLDIIVALYNHHIDTIVVNEEFDIEKFEYHHILVHELVHYLQDINGVVDECVQNMEPLAYELQDKWQKEVDHPGQRVNWLFVYFVNAHCNGGLPSLSE